MKKRIKNVLLILFLLSGAVSFSCSPNLKYTVQHNQSTPEGTALWQRYPMEMLVEKSDVIALVQIEDIEAKYVKPIDKPFDCTKSDELVIYSFVKGNVIKGYHNIGTGQNINLSVYGGTIGEITCGGLGYKLEVGKRYLMFLVSRENQRNYIDYERNYKIFRNTYNALTGPNGCFVLSDDGYVTYYAGHEIDGRNPEDYKTVPVSDLEDRILETSKFL